MTNKFLDLLVLLENALASFYGKVKNLSRFREARNVLEFMELHSYAHAQIIEQSKVKFKRPVIKEKAIIEFQKNITKSVFDQVSTEKDIIKLLKTLADSEESIGMMYKSIVKHLKGLAQYYTDMAKEIEEISNEEMHHRDLLLNDRDKLLQSRNSEE
ncbi:hypothetical protein ACFL20_11715 [Spirochaetota bacterium]